MRRGVAQRSDGGARGDVRVPGFVRVLLVLGLAAWVALPVGGYLLLLESTRSASLAPSVDVWAPVQADTAPMRSAVSLVLARGQASDLYAPAWSGVVEATGLLDGAVIRSGDFVATVAGIDRVAVASDRPFAFELRREDRGADVAALNRLLLDRGLAASESEEFTDRTLRGVRQFAAQIGVPEAERVEAFDPSWLVFLPRAEVQVATTSMHVGSVAPSAGQPIATSRPTIVRALLDAATTTEAGEDDAATVRNAVEAAEGQRLELGGEEVPLAPDRLEVDPSGLDQVDRSVALEQVRVDAVLVSDPQPGTWTVPSAAIGTTAAGGACLVRRGTEGAPERRDVSVVSSVLGRSTVSGELRAGDELLVATATGEPPCS